MSFYPSLCLLWFVLPSPFSTADVFQSLDTALCEISNVSSDHSCRCIKTRVYNKSNLRYFVSSITENSNFLELKLGFLINSFVQMPLKLNKNFLEVILPFSGAATGGVPYKKLFLKISQYLQRNNCGRVSFLIKLRTIKSATLY